MKVSIKNSQKLIKVNLQKTERLLRKALQLLNLPEAELSILFVSDHRMRLLNRQYRGIDRSTDVLSFPQNENIPLKKLQTIREPVLGDIVVSLPKAEKQAMENGIPFNEELKRLLLHGLLHLIGYDHEKSRHAERKMQQITNSLIEKL